MTEDERKEFAAIYERALEEWWDAFFGYVVEWCEARAAALRDRQRGTSPTPGPDSPEPPWCVPPADVAERILLRAGVELATGEAVVCCPCMTGLYFVGSVANATSERYQRMANQYGRCCEP